MSSLPIELATRKVGFWLLLGIVFFPLIFSWLLLRGGYSTVAKIVGFGWLAVSLAILVANLGSAGDQYEVLPPRSSANKLESDSAFKPFKVSVRADPGVEYVVFDVVKLPDGLIEVSSRRKGSSGTSYAKRLVNCSNWNFKYLAEGDTAEELAVLRPDPKMGPLTQGSTSTVISFHACKSVGLAS